MTHWGADSFDVVEGWTNRLDFQLLSCGLPLALTTSDTVTPLLVNARSEEIATSSGDVTVITASSGEVGYTPKTTGVFLANDEPYRMRFGVEDGFGKIAYFPNAEPFIIAVRSA